MLQYTKYHLLLILQFETGNNLKLEKRYMSLKKKISSLFPSTQEKFTSDITRTLDDLSTSSKYDRLADLLVVSFNSSLANYEKNKECQKSLLGCTMFICL